MLGSKSNKDSQQFDTFACLRCETTVTFATSAQRLEARALGRLGRRASLLPEPTCRSAVGAWSKAKRPSDYLASVLI